MKVRISFTVDVDYGQWVTVRRRLAPDAEVSPALCRRNIAALAEDGFAAEMDGYVDYQFV